MRYFHRPRRVLFTTLTCVTANAVLLQRYQCSEASRNANVRSSPLYYPDKRKLHEANKLIANELQSKYWNPSSGSYTHGELWTDANALEDLHNLMLAMNQDTYAKIADNSYIGRAALNPLTDWGRFFDGSYDDAQWVVLLYWKICDYRDTRGLDRSPYMSSALKIYNMVSAAWDNVCHGGVWWSSARTYKNAITNELFLLTSAQAYSITSNKRYLQNALKEYDWLMQSGMQNSQGLFNDGLDSDTCRNNGATTWTYNQAVIASGLGALYAADGSKNVTFLQQAQVSLDATMHTSLTQSNVLKEPCDNIKSGGSACDKDQQLFKGLWMKHIAYFLDWANDTSITAKYSSFLRSQYTAVYHNALKATYDVGSVWYAPNQGGSEWGPQASASGLEAVISAAKVMSAHTVK